MNGQKERIKEWKRGKKREVLNSDYFWLSFLACLVGFQNYKRVYRGSFLVNSLCIYLYMLWGVVYNNFDVIKGDHFSSERSEFGCKCLPRAITIIIVTMSTHCRASLLAIHL